MQYYNAKMKAGRGRKSHGDGRAVCLNRVIVCCVETARAQYPCEIRFTDCSEVLYVPDSPADAAERAAELLDRVCRAGAFAAVSLDKTPDGACARLSVCDENAVLLAETFYALFRGTPDSVIGDRHTESQAAEICEIFKKINAFSQKAEAVCTPERILSQKDSF